MKPLEVFVMVAVVLTAVFIILPAVIGALMRGNWFIVIVGANGLLFAWLQVKAALKSRKQVKLNKMV